MGDKSGAAGITKVWSALGMHVAAIAGSSTALTSLLFDADVPSACLRGASAWLAIVVSVRVTRWLLQRTLAHGDGGAQS